MPPRKAPRVRLPLDTTPSDPANNPTSAARKAYNIIEIRSRILRFLDKRCLASCMRLEKKGIYEVAKEMYREIDYEQAASMKRSTPRQRIYANAVLHIDARELSAMMLPASMKQHIFALALIHCGADYFGLPDVNEYLARYHQPLFNLILEKLRRMGAHRGPSDSILTSHIPSPRHHQTPPQHTDMSTSCTMTFRMSSMTPSPYHTHRALPLSIPYLSDSIYLQDEPFLAKLHTQVSFNGLPVSLCDIVGLYHQQTARRADERLARVTAHNILLWDIAEFQRLAKAAGTSLTSLRLYPESELTSKISFLDLPVLITTIRRDLPNLGVLAVTIGGGEEAEAVCSNMLTESCLDQQGQLQTISIEISEPKTPLFNLIRALSPMCASPARLRIGRPWEESKHAAQTEALRYLQSQPANRRTHLSTIDFATLDVETYSDLHKLQYHDDGRPRRLGEVNAEEWSGIAQTSQNLTSTSLTDLSLLSTGLTDFASSTDQLRSISESANAAEMLDVAERMLEGARAVRVSSAKAAEQVQEVAMRSRQTEDGLAAYVESLRRIIER